MIIDKNELLIALEHATETIGKGFGWPDAAALNPKYDCRLVAIFDVPSDEVLQFFSFGVALKEYRSSLEMLAVKGMS